MVTERDKFGRLVGTRYKIDRSKARDIVSRESRAIKQEVRQGRRFKRRKELLLQTGGFPAGSIEAADFSQKPLKERQMILVVRGLSERTPVTAAEKFFDRKKLEQLRQKRIEETKIIPTLKRLPSKVKETIRHFPENTREAVSKDKELLRNLSTTTFTEPVKKTIRGIVKLTRGTPNTIKNIKDGLENLQRMSSVFKKINKIENTKKVSQSDIDFIKRNIERVKMKNRAMSSRTPALKNMIKNQDVVFTDRVAKLYVKLVGFYYMGFIGAGVLGVLAKVVPKTTKLLGVGLSTAYGLSVVKEAKEKGIITTTIKAIVEIEVMGLGAGRVRGQAKRLLERKPNYNEAVNKIKKSKLPPREKNTLLRNFRKGWEKAYREKPTKRVTKKELKGRIKELKERRELVRGRKLKELLIRDLRKSYKVINQQTKITISKIDKVIKDIPKNTAKRLIKLKNNIKIDLRNLREIGRAHV